MKKEWKGVDIRVVDNGYMLSERNDGKYVNENFVFETFEGMIEFLRTQIPVFGPMPIIHEPGRAA